MKSVLTLFIGLVYIVVASACENKHESINDIYHAWEAKYFVSVESVEYPKDEAKRILLTFKKTGTYELRLDKNRCAGSFVSLTDEQMELGIPMCTRICCDSPFSDKLANLLSQVCSYRIENYRLKLFIPDWGYIEFHLAK